MPDDHPAGGGQPSSGNYGGTVLRRSFRIGLALGLLGGLAFLLVKLFGNRRSSPAVTSPLAPSDWPPLVPDPDQAEPAAPATWLQPDPDAPTVPAKQAAQARKAAAADPPAPAKRTGGRLTAAWVEPKGDVCPTSHPVKAKLSSKIFHLPGMLNYDRTKPDRCYRDGDAAADDGLRAAKR